MIETVQQLIEALQRHNPTSLVRVNKKWFIEAVPPVPGTTSVVTIQTQIPECDKNQ